MLQSPVGTVARNSILHLRRHANHDLVWTRYVRKHGFLKFMAKRRVIVGDEKKPVDKAHVANKLASESYWYQERLEREVFFCR